MLALETRLRLPDRINLRLDKLSMASSIEARAPFMDHELMQAVADLPRCLLRRGGISKWILRQAIAPRVPAAVIERPKAPFRAPDAWFPTHPDLAWVLSDDHVAECGLVRPEAVAAPRRRGVAERPARKRLYNLFVLHAWFRCFHHDASPAPESVTCSPC